MARIENRVFFPQAALDKAIVDGTVDFTDGELTLLSDRRRFRLAEAVLVVREVSGAGDGHELVGRAKARSFLEQMGAEIVETSMLIGDAAYDVVAGWLGAPVGTFAEYASSTAGRTARQGKAGPETGTDEELLARWAADNL